MAFFRDYYKNYKPETNNGLRNCQNGAIWATKSHFTNSSDPALLSLPTGSGKTALMMALSFEFKVNKILIITPSQIIRYQTTQKFSILDDLDKIGVYDSETKDFPKVFEQKGRISSAKKWKELSKKYDVIVSTPNSTSSHLKGVSEPKKNTFDLVFIDEAHHTSANMYKSILKTFIKSKIILLTATPFRSDNKRIPGNLIYHYSISQAVKDEIYRVVNYKPIKTNLKKIGKTTDEKIAKYGIKQFNKDLKINKNSKLLIKTNSIYHAEELFKIYKKYKINVDLIHSKKSINHNKKVIEDCKNNKINGIICVGMAGEGLDIPTLKIAILHRSPQTLPETIQFIGRLSRLNKNEQKGNSILIADPDFIQGEVKELYKYDDGWEKIIPKLIDEKIFNAKYIGKLGNQTNRDISFSIEEVTPFFSVKVFEIDNINIDKNYPNNFPSDIEFLILESILKNLFVIISKKEENIPWISDSLYKESKNHIHIYYIKDNILFEHSTSEYYSNKIRKSIFIKSKIKTASINKIIQALKNTDGHYVMVGLDNITGTTNSNPKYKTYIGKEIENSLRISDGRTYTAGHVLAINKNKTIGISTKNSKIWSLKRDSLKNFIKWCDELYSLIHLNNFKYQIPRMNILAKSKFIKNIPETPIAVVFDDTILQQNNTKLFIKQREYINPIFKIIFKRINKEKKKIFCNLLINNIKYKIEFCVKGPIYWKVKNSDDISFFIEKKDNKNQNYKSLSDFLEDFPPLIILESGKSMKNNILYTPKIEEERFNQDLFKSKKIDWKDTDIFNEAKKVKKPYKYNIQNKILSIIEKGRKHKDFFFIDDSAGEIADIIWFNFQENDKNIYFIHCKFKHRNNKKNKDRTPNADKRNIIQLIEQGIRCGYWVKSSTLLKQLINRLNNTDNSKVLHNREKEFRKFENQYNPFEWNFKIILVQPGLDKFSVFKEKITNVEKLLSVLLDRTKIINADLEVWGNEKKHL